MPETNSTRTDRHRPPRHGSGDGEAGWRSPEQANVPGSGLGLAIAAELARASGCTLALLPHDPRGLIVELRTPDRSLAARPAPAPQAGHP